MSKAFKLQDPGEGIREAEVLAVLVSEGDQVSEGDPVIEIETDKAAMEVRADFDGIIDELKVKEGTVAKVGDVLMTYGGEEQGAEPTKIKEESRKKKEPQQAETQPEKSAQTREDADDGNAERTEGEPGEAKPAEAKRDETRQTESRKAKSQAKQNGDAKRSSKGKAQKDATGPENATLAAPSTRRLARELEVDIDEVDGTGPRGRVLDEDLKSASSGQKGEAAETRDEQRADEHEETAQRSRAEREEKAQTDSEKRATSDVDNDAEPDVGSLRELERVPLEGSRRATAKHMVRAWQIPHVMHHDVADFSGLAELKRQHGELIDDQSEQPTVTAYLVKAIASALRSHPSFNVRLDESSNEIVRLASRHVGVAVASSHGLLVPVVRNPDQLSVFEVARKLRRLSEKTRRGELTAKERRGASITITNVGGIGGRAFTPIINAPQSCILGIGAAFEEFIPDEQGKPKLAKRLPLSFAFDHRLNDGAEAARFVNTIKRLLASPAAFSLYA